MRFAKAFVSTGEIELMSTTILPAESPAATPFGSNRAAATCGVSGTMVMITSARRATSLPEAQTLAPCSTSGGGTGRMS